MKKPETHERVKHDHSDPDDWQTQWIDVYHAKPADDYMNWQKEIIERKTKQVDKLRKEIKDMRGVYYRLNRVLDEVLD